MVEVMMIVGIVIALVVIVAIGGGAGYWFFVSSRPKKMTWKARVYQPASGIIPAYKLQKKGAKTIDYQLSELKEFTTDVVERIDKRGGHTTFWLQKLKKPVPAVTADCVEIWENNDKWVRILLQEDSCTLLKSGYNKRLGNMIFKPLPYDRSTMIKTEMDERKERIANTRDILAQITPFIVAGIAILGLVTAVYFEVQGAVKIAELNSEGMKVTAKAYQSATDKLLVLFDCTLEGADRKVEKEEPPEIPP